MTKCHRNGCNAWRSRYTGGRPPRYCSNACRQAAYRQRQRSSLRVLFSSKKEDYATPWSLYRDLNREFGPFTLDAAASLENAKCRQFLSEDDDALSVMWTGRVFLNPPWSRRNGGVGPWVRHALKCASSTAELVCCVLPARVDTTWWHDVVLKHAVVHRAIRGRVTFGGAAGPAPFPVAIVVFRNAKSVTKVQEKRLRGGRRR